MGGGGVYTHGVECRVYGVVCVCGGGCGVMLCWGVVTTRTQLTANGQHAGVVCCGFLSCMLWSICVNAPCSLCVPLTPPPRA